MQQFVVPQFIDVEDKIIGPLTVRQFIILMVAGFFVFLEFRLAAFGFFVLEAAVTLGIAILFAFVKFNGMPFHYFLFNFIQNRIRPKLRVWRKAVDETDLTRAVHAPTAVVQVKPDLVKPQLRQSRLKELALTVDTGGAYQPEEE